MPSTRHSIVSRTPPFSYDAKKWRKFLDKLNKVRDQFHAEKLHVRFLNGAECQDYVDRYFAMNFRDAHYSMTNFKVDDEDILIGDFNCEQSLILQYYMLISKCCIDLIINSIIETLYLLIITFLSDMPGMKCKQYKKINEYFDPDIDFGIKQYVADYQAVYLTFDIEASLMWQSGIVAKWRLNENRARLCSAEREPIRRVRVALSKKEKSATSWGDCGRGEINKFFCSDCEWAVAHATRSSEGSQGCRED